MEVEGRTLIGVGEWRKKDDKENWKVIRLQILKHFPGARKNKTGGSKRDVGRGATAERTMKTSRGVRIIKEKEVEYNPTGYFLPVFYRVRIVKLLTQHVVRGDFWVPTNCSAPC